jgi:hypothetical protein
MDGLQEITLGEMRLVHCPAMTGLRSPRRQYLFERLRMGIGRKSG